MGQLSCDILSPSSTMSSTKLPDGIPELNDPKPISEMNCPYEGPAEEWKRDVGTPYFLEEGGKRFSFNYVYEVPWEVAVEVRSASLAASDLLFWLDVILCCSPWCSHAI